MKKDKAVLSWIRLKLSGRIDVIFSISNEPSAPRDGRLESIVVCLPYIANYRFLWGGNLTKGRPVWVLPGVDPAIDNTIPNASPRKGKEATVCSYLAPELLSCVTWSISCHTSILWHHEWEKRAIISPCHKGWVGAASRWDLGWPLSCLQSWHTWKTWVRGLWGLPWNYLHIVSCKGYCCRDRYQNKYLHLVLPVCFWLVIFPLSFLFLEV